MSNAYACKLAPKVQRAYSHADITVEADDNWPGKLFVYHSAGYRGLIHLGRVDNRRTPDVHDVMGALDAIDAQVRRDAHDHRVKPQFRDMALRALRCVRV